MSLTCSKCGREFEGDPLYDAVGAVPYPENHARQVIAYHTLRLRFEEHGCEVLGLRPSFPNAAEAEAWGLAHAYEVHPIG